MPKLADRNGLSFLGVHRPLDCSQCRRRATPPPRESSAPHDQAIDNVCHAGIGLSGPRKNPWRFLPAAQVGWVLSGDGLLFSRPSP